MTVITRAQNPALAVDGRVELQRCKNLLFVTFLLFGVWGLGFGMTRFQIILLLRKDGFCHFTVDFCAHSCAYLQSLARLSALIPAHSRSLPHTPAHSHTLPHMLMHEYRWENEKTEKTCVIILFDQF